MPVGRHRWARLFWLVAGTNARRCSFRCVYASWLGCFWSLFLVLFCFYVFFLIRESLLFLSQQVGHEVLPWDGSGPSSLVWWVCGWPSHEWLASTSLQLCPSFHTLTHWCSSANKFHVVAQTSSALLLASAAASSRSFSNSSILDKNSSKISSSSDLVVGQWCTECDHKRSALSFCLWRRYAVPWCLGGSCPEPPWAVLSNTAFSLPLSGGKMSPSNSMSLMLGDSCAPASNPPPTGGGLLVASWSSTPHGGCWWLSNQHPLQIRLSGQLGFL